KEQMLHLDDPLLPRKGVEKCPEATRAVCGSNFQEAVLGADQRRRMLELLEEDEMPVLVHGCEKRSQSVIAHSSEGIALARFVQIEFLARADHTLLRPGDRDLISLALVTRHQNDLGTPLIV